MADSWTIEAVDLKKHYDGTHAVNGLSLHVPKGSIFGFLGKNGAGKTTTIKMLLGMTKPSSGRARVFDLPVDDKQTSVEIRRRTGFVSEEKDLYRSMTVREMVDFTRPFYPRWRADLQDRYLKSFELPSERTVKDLSKGMQTKLALLLVLCRGAELLILDEPTSGLDPAASEEVLQAIVSHVAREEMTVFFSSHQLAEVDQIADRVAIVNRGRTVLSGALDDLREHYRRIQLVFEGDAPAAALATPGILRAKRQGRVLTLLVSENADRLIDEARALNPVSVESGPVTLKEIFLETVAVEE